MEPILGEIRTFAADYAPVGWAICDGSLLSVSQNAALFSLIGTSYGGDGKANFALPDLRGRVVIQNGQLAGGAAYPFAQPGGSQTVTLAVSNMAAHQHTMLANKQPATTNLAYNAFLSTAQDLGNKDSTVLSYLPYDAKDTTLHVVPLNAGTLDHTGGSQAHNNRQPYLSINYIIALNGTYPDFS